MLIAGPSSSTLTVWDHQSWLNCHMMIHLSGNMKKMFYLDINISLSLGTRARCSVRGVTMTGSRASFCWHLQTNNYQSFIAPLTLNTGQIFVSPVHSWIKIEFAISHSSVQIPRHGSHLWWWYPGPQSTPHQVHRSPLTSLFQIN